MKKLSLIVFLVISSVIIVGSVSAANEANFSSNETGSAPVDVNFTDTSTVYHPLRFSWNFTDSSVQPTISIPQPSGWNWTGAPISFTRNGTAISTTFNVSDYFYTGAGKTYYVDGSVAASGDCLSWATACKIPKTAQEKGDVDVVLVKKNAWGLPYTRLDIDNTLNRNMSIIAVESGVIFSSWFENQTYGKTAGLTYTWNVSRSGVASVYDTSVLDAHGHYTKYTLQGSSAAVDANAGSWYQDGSNMLFVHTLAGTIPNITTKLSTTLAVEGQATGRTAYIENIIFQGGSGFTTAATSGGGYANVYFKNVIFSYSTGNGLSATGSYTYLQNCEAYANYDDGFNYHIGFGAIPYAIEVNCRGYDNGADGDIDNGSTIHDGGRIIRYGGEYYRNVGGNVHDINNLTQSWNLQSSAHDSLGGAANVDWRVGIGDADTAKMYLDTVTGYTSTQSLEGYASNAIYERSINLASMSVTGTLTTYESQIHRFASDGCYNINYSVRNATATYWQNRTIAIGATCGGSPPVASFTTNTTTGTSPLAVQFTDTSTNTPTGWGWFYQNVTGDNIITQFSTLKNPIKTFTIAGNYTIHLNATNAYGSNVTPNNYWINVSSNISPSHPPVANFVADNLSICRWNSTQFNDTSINTPTSWYWMFGDNSTSTSQNVSHTYNDIGTFSVYLNATNADGFDWENKTNYITVNSCIPSPVVMQCDPQTGTIPLSLSSSTYNSLTWQWSSSEILTKISLDGQILPADIDNATPYITTAGFVGDSWHALKIYNATSFGRLNCKTNTSVQGITSVGTPLPAIVPIVAVLMLVLFGTRMKKKEQKEKEEKKEKE